jgi:hypothetical protein
MEFTKPQQECIFLSNRNGKFNKDYDRKDTLKVFLISYFYTNKLVYINISPNTRAIFH